MFHFTKTVFKRGIPIMWAYFSWMRKYAKHPEKYPIELRYKKLHNLLYKLSLSLGVEFFVEGKEKFPDEACCIVANHLSSFDPLTFISVLDKPTTFVSKKEVDKMPFIGKCTRDIDGLFIDRQDLKQSLRIMLKVQDDLANKKDKNWIIFPEGTRNKDQMHNVADFHHGTFRPAVKANVPIVPVAIYGTFRVLKLKPQFKKYPVHIKFLDPIMPEEYKNMTTQEIALLAQNRIDQALSYDLRKENHLEMVKNNKKYVFNKNI